MCIQCISFLFSGTCSQITSQQKEIYGCYFENSNILYSHLIIYSLYVMRFVFCYPVMYGLFKQCPKCFSKHNLIVSNRLIRVLSI